MTAASTVSFACSTDDDEVGGFIFLFFFNIGLDKF